MTTIAYQHCDHEGHVMTSSFGRLLVVDAVEILGSRVTIDEDAVLLARQIKKGEATWTLRDASGRPLWSGRRK